jgi:hypothetical protein
MVRVGEAGEDQPGTTREALTTSVDPASSKSVHDIPTAANGHGETTLEPLDRDWLLDLQVLGRSPKTIDWYRKHVHGYFLEGSVRTLDQITAAELKGYLAAVQARGPHVPSAHVAMRPAHLSRRRRPGRPTVPRFRPGECVRAGHFAGHFLGHHHPYLSASRDVPLMFGRAICRVVFGAAA